MVFTLFVNYKIYPMYKLKNKLFIFLLLAASVASAQNPEVIRNYINQYKNLAIAEMQRTGVPASIKLAQGIHETTAGTSELVLKSNNHFGIKCKTEWRGESVSHDDDARGECFRKYPSSADSYKDHSNFLRSSQRYASLFNMDPTDYKNWAYGLKQAGYATNPKYPQIIIKLIEEFQLQDYTLIALGTNKPAIDEVVSVSVTEKPVHNKVDLEPVEQKPLYPEGDFIINLTKVVYVKKGTSYLGLANQYNLDLSRIFEFNDLPRAEVTEKDQLIYLQRKRKVGNNEFHTVQPGETLHDIAQQEAIRLESLLELNWLKKNDMPAAGEQLNLHNKSTVMPKLAVRENYSLTQGKNISASH